MDVFRFGVAVGRLQRPFAVQDIGVARWKIWT